MSEKLIAIKGFQMPENCIKCVMQCGGWCGVAPVDVDERVAPTVDEAIRQGKPEWCPLVEIEAEPVREGLWIRRETVLDTECKCSVCGYKDFVPKHDNYWFRRKFCPNCGSMNAHIEDDSGSGVGQAFSPD